MGWGIIMTVFTLFGMLALVVASCSMEAGTGPFEATQAPEAPAGSAAHPTELKKAA